MRVALDTNVLAYAEGVNGIEKRDIVLELVRNLPQEAAVIPFRCLENCSMFSCARQEGHGPTPARPF